MNAGEILDYFRRISGDVEEPYQWNDDQLMILLNEAQEEAAKRSPLLKTSDISFNETPAKATITIAGSGSGTISQILVDNINIIANPVSYRLGDNLTAQLIGNEINSLNLFNAVVLNNVITLTPQAGGGSYYNRMIPIIIQDTAIATSTAFTGGIDGICKIQLLPNQKEYKFSPKIQRFENFYFGDMVKNAHLRDYRELSDGELAMYNKTGNPDTIIYGMSNDSFLVGRMPNAKSFIRATVYYKPINRLKRASDIPEIPEDYHSRLVDYMLYKVYSTVDAEVDHIELADRHKKIFEEEFNDNSFTNAFETKNSMARFFGDRSTYNTFDI